MECRKCGQQVILPFRCPYCGGHFCSKHRLPENHECPGIHRATAPRKERKPVVLQEQKSQGYRRTYPRTGIRRKIRFSNREIKHLVVATLLVAAIGLSISMYQAVTPADLALLTVILTASFFVHEMAHKITAQRRGFWAEFRLVLTGALLTLISVISPFFKVISPGAVMISGFVDPESMGRISIAGPSTNIALSTIFLIIYFLFPRHPFILGATFNAWIALFNLIPFGMLDGYKIFRWNKMIWISAFTASVVLTAICYMHIPF